MTLNGTPRRIVRVDDRLFGMALPHSDEAEAHVLGAMVLDGRFIPKVQKALRAGDFHRETNQHLFARICAAFLGNKGIVDLDLLTDLDDDQKQTIAKYARETPGPATIPHFVRVVAEKAHRRRIVEKAGMLAWQAQQDDDTDDLRAMVAEALAELTARPDGEGYFDLPAASDALYTRLSNSERQVYETGLRLFDEHVGLPRQGLVVIAGSQGAGKSTLALQMLRSVAIAQRVPTWIFSFEMPAERIIATWVSQDSGYNLHYAMRDGATGKELDAACAAFESWSGAQVRIDRGNPTAQEIYNTLAQTRRDGFRVALVDYVQNLPASPGARVQSQTDRVQESMRILQRSARELDMLVICVSQLVLSAAREHKRPPTMWDIRDSGAIADVADMLLAVWRPGHGVADADSDHSPDEGLLCVLKTKYGEPKNIRVRMLGARMTFREDETAMT